MATIRISRPAVNPFPTRPVQPQRPKPQPRPRLIHAPEGDKPGLFIVHDGRHTDDYEVSRCQADFGLAFRVEKMLFCEQGPVYHVNIDAELGEVGQHICDCPGFERWGRCKHVRSLLTFLQTGQLSAELDVAPAAEPCGSWFEPDTF